MILELASTDITKSAGVELLDEFENRKQARVQAIIIKNHKYMFEHVEPNAR